MEKISFFHFNISLLSYSKLCKIFEVRKTFCLILSKTSDIGLQISRIRSCSHLGQCNIQEKQKSYQQKDYFKLS